MSKTYEMLHNNIFNNQFLLELEEIEGLIELLQFIKEARKQND